MQFIVHCIKYVCVGLSVDMRVISCLRAKIVSPRNASSTYFTYLLKFAAIIFKVKECPSSKSVNPIVTAGYMFFTF